VTQRHARKLVREAGGNPLVDGYCSTRVSASAFAAVALSPKAMVRKFDTMKAERAAFNAWKKQTSVVVD